MDLGWTIRDSGTSHIALQSPRSATFTIVRKPRDRVKRVYLRMILKEIEASEG
jgi:predicted RNA binding protein YcfA (HicA-like mRNA interferase family)